MTAELMSSQFTKFVKTENNLLYKLIIEIFEWA